MAVCCRERNLETTFLQFTIKKAFCFDSLFDDATMGKKIIFHYKMLSSCFFPFFLSLTKTNFLNALFIFIHEHSICFINKRNLKTPTHT